MARTQKKESDKMERKRPLIPLDWKMIDEYLIAHATGTEIAGLIGCHPDTIYDRCFIEHGVIFSHYQLAKREKGKASLRKKQFDTAMSGNVTMQIFLGKHWLGQHDKMELTTNEPEVRKLLSMWEKQNDKNKPETITVEAKNETNSG